MGNINPTTKREEKSQDGLEETRVDTKFSPSQKTDILEGESAQNVSAIPFEIQLEDVGKEQKLNCDNFKSNFTTVLYTEAIQAGDVTSSNEPHLVCQIPVENYENLNIANENIETIICEKPGMCVAETADNAGDHLDDYLEDIQNIKSNYSVKNKPFDSNRNQPPRGPPPVYQNQTPYYQQQVISSQPVYVQGAPPVNATRTPAYQPGQREQQPSWERLEDAQGVRIFTSSFDSTKIRHRFVQRVYIILAVMLLTTMGIMMLCLFVPHLKQYFMYNIGMLWLFLILYIFFACMLQCYQYMRKTFPINFILLGCLTLSMGFFLGILSAHYTLFAVLISIGITTGVVLLISVFAWQTKIDITGKFMYILIAMIVFLIFGLVTMIVTMFTRIRILQMVYAGLGALLFCWLLAFDTQTIIGGRKIEISPEEYISGALQLYIDIVMIFMFILQLLGGRN